jgi:hypothetical protein
MPAIASNDRAHEPYYVPGMEIIEHGSGMVIRISRTVDGMGFPAVKLLNAAEREALFAWCRERDPEHARLTADHQRRGEALKMAFEAIRDLSGRLLKWMPAK